MKHFKQFLLAVLVALASCVTVFAFDFEVDGIYYNILSEENLTCEVKGKDNGSYASNIIIPSAVKFNGKTFSVTSIGEYAFSLSDNLASIEIPNSVTKIGESAFSIVKLLNPLNCQNQFID